MAAVEEAQQPAPMNSWGQIHPSSMDCAKATARVTKAGNITERTAASCRRSLGWSSGARSKTCLGSPPPISGSGARAARKAADGHGGGNARETKQAMAPRR